MQLTISILPRFMIWRVSMMIGITPPKFNQFSLASLQSYPEHFIKISSSFVEYCLDSNWSVRMPEHGNPDCHPFTVHQALNYPDTITTAFGINIKITQKRSFRSCIALTQHYKMITMIMTFDNMLTRQVIADNASQLQVVWMSKNNPEMNEHMISPWAERESIWHPHTIHLAYPLIVIQTIGELHLQTQND